MHRPRTALRLFIVWLFLTPFLPFSLPPTVAEAAPGEPARRPAVVYLEGTPYELGHQHGTQLRAEVQRAVGSVLGRFRAYLKIPLLNAWLVNGWLDRSWRQSARWIPPEYLEELRGLADGSGVSLRELWRLHAIPDRTYACSGLAVWGRASRDGRLIHTRNLDWNMDTGIQEAAAVFVVRPQGPAPGGGASHRAFVSAGWAGFIGVLTGVNEQQVSIGQVGAETDDLTYAGIPMPFLMRRVMEEAGDVDEAVRIIREARRTVGINYLIADAKARRAVAVETTRSQIAVFEADDPQEQAVAYARPLADAVFRADTAVDPAIRAHQLASGGKPAIPGLEPPTGSAYETRYLGQSAGILARYGTMDAEGAKAIATAVAPDSNVQSVIFAWPDLWVANAQGATPAARTPYHHFDLDELLTRQ